MEKKLYEVHNLENKKLPIIFHYDTVSLERKRPIEANWHNNIEILYCTEGKGQIICNSVIYDVKMGDILVVNTNVLHAFQSNERLRYYCLIVDSDFLAANEIFVDKIEFDSFIQSETANVLYEKVVKAIATQDEYRIAAIRAETLKLVIYLARNHSAQLSLEDRRKAITDENIKLAIGYIKSNFSQKLTLEMVASEVGLSKYYLAHAFKKATGMTVVAYINTIRCNNARKLLQQQKVSVNEVAVKCGFENNSYFSKTFKSVMGCLPSEVLKGKEGT